MAREYADNVLANISQLRKIQKFEEAVFDYVTGDLDEDELSTSLAVVSTVLSVFLCSTVAGAVSMCANLFSIALSGSDKRTVQNMIQKGYMDIGRKISFLEDNPQYDRVDVKFPFIEYTVDGKQIRFVSGNGVIQRCHGTNSGGWTLV